MGSVKIGGERESRRSPNTEKEFSRPTTMETVSTTIDRIQEFMSEHANDYVCMLLGAGAHPRSTYSELRKDDGIIVAWTGSILPAPINLVLFFVASQAGVIRVNSPEKMAQTFKKLMKQSMAGVYIVPAEYAGNLTAKMIEQARYGEQDFNVKDTSRYFRYVVDADNSGSVTGMIESFSYGIQCPEQLKTLTRESD